MSRKHFQAIADALRATMPADTDTGRRYQWRISCRAMADMCAGANPRFDRGRFLTACGVSS